MIPTIAIAALVMTGMVGMTSAAASPSPEAERLVQEGRKLYRAGSLADALPLFEQAVASGAESPRLFYELGRCLKRVHGDAATDAEMMSKAIPLLEKEIDAVPPPAEPAPFYYLSTIYLHELGEGVKGVPLAQRAVKLYEQGAFAELADPDSQFRMGRLFVMASRKDEAVALYEKAIAGYDRSGDPDVQNLAVALEDIASSLASKQEWVKAAGLYERLLGLTSLPERDRFSAAVVMLRADRFEAAERALGDFTDDGLSTEAHYIRRILRRYLDLGSPPLPAEPEVKDDDWLNTSILQAAAELGAIRKEEGDRAEEEMARTAEAERQKQMDAAAKGKMSKGGKYGPPPEPIVISNEGIATPPSPERQEAERRFFTLMAEYLRRGNLVRNFALSAGIAQLIFR